MASCETNGHVRGHEGKCIFCKVEMSTDMTAPASSPLPWRIEQIDYPGKQDVSFEILDVYGRFVLQTRMREIKTESFWIEEDRQNVQFAVRAVNSHAALVGALEAIAANAHDGIVVAQIARNALARAGNTGREK